MEFNPEAEREEADRIANEQVAQGTWLTLAEDHEITFTYAIGDAHPVGAYCTGCDARFDLKGPL